VLVNDLELCLRVTKKRQYFTRYYRTTFLQMSDDGNSKNNTDEMMRQYVLAMRTGVHYDEHERLLKCMYDDDDDDDSTTFIKSHLVTHIKDWKGLCEGDLVEARVEDDQLYYTATILAFSEDRCTILLKFEDNTEESTPHQWIMPLQREIVFRGEQVLVIRGHYAVGGFPRKALFLTFKDSPQLYQSAMIEDNDVEVVPFEVNQTVLLSVAILFKQDKRKKKSSLRILVIGCGGGAVPLGFSKLCAPSSRIDVVDLSREVISVASTYFGISRAKNIRTHVRDGFSYIKDCVHSTSLNILVVDVAAHNAVDGDDLEMPPETFVSLEFLTHARRVLKNAGLLVMNIIAKEEMLKTIIKRMRKYFENIKIFGLDPNYIFFCSVCDLDVLDLDHEDLLRCVQDAGMVKVVPEILDAFLAKSLEFSEKGIAMGWIPSNRFVRGLFTDEDYSV
jgi:SAM-dependent methyltransferase